MSELFNAVLYKRVYGHPIYLQTDLLATDLPTIRSIKSVDSFFSHPIYNWQIGKIDRMNIISIGNINCHRSVDLILQIGCLLLQIGSLIFVDRLSHFCRSVVSFFQIGCLIFVDQLSYFCRSVVSFVVFVDRLSYFCRSVVLFFRLVVLFFVKLVKMRQPIYKNGKPDLKKQDNQSTKMRQLIHKNETTDLQK